MRSIVGARVFADVHNLFCSCINMYIHVHALCGVP